jgi:hypothetical protein
MNKHVFWLFLVLSITLTTSGALLAAEKPSIKTQKLTAEVVSVDPMAKTITVKDDNGQTKTITAVESAAMYIRNLKPGVKAALTCRQDEKGEIVNVTKFKVLKK